MSTIDDLFSLRGQVALVTGASSTAPADPGSLPRASEDDRSKFVREVLMPRQTIVVGALVLLGLASAETGFARVPCRDHEPAVCNQIFAPARCVALSVGGKPLRRPLLARGTNACVATDKLRKKACARGLPWRDLAEGEVLCVQLAN